MKSRMPSMYGVISLVLFRACCPEVEPDIYPFDIESVMPVNFNHTKIEFLDESEVTSALSYAIVVETTTPDIKNGKQKPAKGGIFKSPDCSSRVDPIFELSDQVVALSITATGNFSPIYPAGTDLTALFRPVLITKDNPFSTPPSIVEHISGGLNLKDLNSSIVIQHSIVDYSRQPLTTFFGLKLVENPSLRTLLQFKIELTLQSGKKLTGLSKPIWLE